MTDFNQGDIILVKFPFSNLSNFKLRPALIISNSEVNKTKDIICTQITSNLHNDKFSYKLENSILTNPLLYESEIRCHKIFTLEISMIDRKLSSIKSSNLALVLQKIHNFIS